MPAAAVGLAAGIEAATRAPTCVVPVHALDHPPAATVGLGDTFVAGVLAGVLDATARRGRTRRPATMLEP